MEAVAALLKFFMGLALVHFQKYRLLIVCFNFQALYQVLGGQEDVNSEADLMKLAYTHCQLKSISKEDIENWSNLSEEKKKNHSIKYFS